VHFEVTHILYPPITEKKWEYNDRIAGIYRFQGGLASVRREVLYSILREFGILRKLAGLSKMCLSETYNKVYTGKNISGKFDIQNGPKLGNVLSPLRFDFAFDYAIRRVKDKEGRLKLNGTHQVFAYAYDVNSMGGKYR
jgi:hypothetical protein